jgi:O-acetyl-ADP-ribose deacetylase (regulator of RNase III)
MSTTAAIRTRKELKKKRAHEVEINFLACLSLRLPENIRILRALAELLTTHGCYDEGLLAARRLVRLCPREAELWYNLGCSYALLQRADEALEALQESINLGFKNIQQMFKDQHLRNLWQNHAFLAMAGRASMSERFEVVLGSLATCKVDAVVNPANNSLLGTVGNDYELHHAAGPHLLEACLRLNGCKTGDAKITRGYDLPAQHIIHTVGPIWKGGYYCEDELLAMCYQRCMDLAIEHGLKTIAFPAISTGGYSYPTERATRIAIDTIVKNLVRSPSIQKVIFVCYDRALFDIYTKILKNKI